MFFARRKHPLRKLPHSAIALLKGLMKRVFAPIRFIWHAIRGNWLHPWRSPYLRWRMETYSGIPADSIDAQAFWKFMSAEKGRLFHFLRWTAEIDGYARTHAKKSSTPNR